MANERPVLQTETINAISEIHEGDFELFISFNTMDAQLLFSRWLGQLCDDAKKTASARYDAVYRQVAKEAKDSPDPSRVE